MAKERLWHKTIKGRRIEGIQYTVTVTGDPGSVAVMCTWDSPRDSAGGAVDAYLTVDMARNLRAAIDEAIERASAG